MLVIVRVVVLHVQLTVDVRPRKALLWLYEYGHRRALVVIGATGVTFTVAEAGPFPAALVANTEHAYSVPLVSRETVIGLVVPVAVRAVPPVTPQEAV